MKPSAEQRFAVKAVDKNLSRLVIVDFRAILASEEKGSRYGKETSSSSKVE